MAVANAKLDELRAEVAKLQEETNPPRLLLLMAETVLENLSQRTPTGADHGLCGDQECQSCGDTLADVARQVENSVFEDLEAAAQATGLQQEADLVATAFNQYREGKQAVPIGSGPPDDVVFHLEGFGDIRAQS